MDELGHTVALTADFETAIERVTEALGAEGFGVITRIDVDKAFKDKHSFSVGALSPAQNALANEAKGELTMRRPHQATFILALAALVILIAGSARAEEKVTVNAVASVEGVGQVYEIGEDKAVFLGGLAGVIFVDEGKGSLNAGEIVCPGSLEIDLKDGTQEGSGHCILTGTNGRLFAKWSCSGTHGAGCSGKFELVSGTNRFHGVTGKSKFEIRGTSHKLMQDALRGEYTGSFLALVRWEDFTYRIPQ